MAESRCVAVTGATGFVGARLCRELTSSGAGVRALVRSSRQLPAGVVAVHGDVTDSAALQQLMEGADAVVHLAARVHIMRERAADPVAEFRRVNRDGTQAVLEAATAAGVQRFIFASSVKAAAETADRPLTARDAARPTDPYGTSKLEAEQLVRRAGELGRIDALVLRLPLVYGPEMRGNMLRLFEAVSRGVPLPLLWVRNARSLLFVGNATAAIRHVLGAATFRAGTFFLSDGEDLSTPELIAAIGAAVGRRPVLYPVPGPLYRVVLQAGTRARAGTRLHAVAQATARLVGSLRVDGTEFRHATGFVPPYSAAAGLRETADWFLSR